MKKIVPLFIFICLTVSCEQKQKRVKKEDGIITLSVENEKKEVLTVEEVSYVKLREKTNFLFSDINKIIVKNDRIYILDKYGANSLLCFSITGDFIFNFSKKGQGPGEYLRLWDFDVTEKFVYLYDRHQKKMLQFDLEGTFIKEEKTDFRASAFKVLPNGFLFSLVKEEEKSPLLIKTDTNFENAEIVLKYAKNYIDDKGTNNVFQNYKDGFLFNKAVNDSVYILDKEGNLKSTYVFDFGSNKVPVELKNSYEKLVDVREAENYVYLMETPMFINNQYFIGESFYKGNKATLIYDLNKKESCVFPWLAEKLDLKHIILPITSFENTIVGWMDSDVYENLSEKPVLSEDFIKHLEEDGKILVFYHIKK